MFIFIKNLLPKALLKFLFLLLFFIFFTNLDVDLMNFGASDGKVGTYYTIEDAFNRTNVHKTNIKVSKEDLVDKEERNSRRALGKYIL